MRELPISKCGVPAGVSTDYMPLAAAASALAILLTFLFPPLVGASASINPNEIPSILINRGNGLTAFKAVMSVSSVYDNGKSRQDVRGFLLYRRPDDFRFQGVGPTGNPLFELVVRANGFELYIPTDGKIIKGGRDCFQTKFPDVAELETLIPLALLQWKLAKIEKVLSQDSTKTIVRLGFKKDMWLATLDSSELKLLRLERVDTRGKELTADFGEFGSGEFRWLPLVFNVVSPRGGWKSLIKIKNIELNPFLVESNFKLEPVFSVKTESCQ